MPHDMKLIVKNSSLRRVLAGGIFKSLPHVHNRKPYILGFLQPWLVVEDIHVLF
ncbi:hypothetical protein MTYM_00695 [Methylococcales bacterium]|nr:hypothetical protein MTYM_00695 [Methylococcales bacterium]